MRLWNASHEGLSTGIDGWDFDPPQEILQSRLFAQGGYLVVDGLFDEETLKALRAEADMVRVQGYAAVCRIRTERRAGGRPGAGLSPGYGRRPPLGSVWMPANGRYTRQAMWGRSLLNWRQVLLLLRAGGDFLALHRDILQCDIAVITSLTHSIVDGSTGELTVYPEFIHEPLSTVRRAGRASSTSVPLDRGQTAILLGGIVPHEVVPTCAGQDRIVAVNCYRVQIPDVRKAEDGSQQSLPDRHNHLPLAKYVGD